MADSKNGFMISRARCSVTSGKTFVVQGYAMDGYLDNVRPRAAVFVGGKPYRALKCEMKLVKLPPIQVKRREGNTISYMGVFYVDMSSIRERLAEKSGAKLVIICERKDKTRLMIYKNNLENVFETLKEYCFSVEDSYVENGKTILKGWLSGTFSTIIKIEGIKHSRADHEKKNQISAGVDGTDRVGRSETTRILDYHIDFVEKPEVNFEFPEMSQDADLGFVISVEGEYRKLRISMMEENRSSSKDVITGRSNLQLDSSGGISIYSEKLVRNLKNYGFKETLNKVKVRLSPQNAMLNKRYNRWINQITPDDAELEVQKKKLTDYKVKPLISVLVPLYETDEGFLGELIQSVKKQSYSNWEICFSDGSRNPSRLKSIVGEYIKQDDRIKYIAEKEGPLGISTNTNQAYSISSGEFIVLGDHDDLFAPDAFFQIIRELNSGDNIDVLYSDEDKTNSANTKRFDPSIKPDFNQELLESCNYITHMFVVRRSLIEETGLFDDTYNGAQDYDFILRCTEKARNICHIKKVTYSWRINDTSTAGNPGAKMYAYDAGALALQAHYDRLGINAKAEIGDHLGYYHTKYELNGNETLYVVVTNSDQDEKYKSTVESIKSKSVFKGMEFIRIKSEGSPLLSRQLNRGIEEVEIMVNSDEKIDPSQVFILFIEAGVTMMGEDDIYEMLSYISCNKNTGAIGAKIYCSDGTISHSGVILGAELHPAYMYLSYGKYKDLYFNASAYSALRRGVFMMRLSDIRAYGEFSGRYRGEYSVIEYTYKMAKNGKRIIYNANSNFRFQTHRGIEADEIFEEEKWTTEDKKLFDKRYVIEKTGDIFYPR